MISLPDWQPGDEITAEGLNAPRRVLRSIAPGASRGVYSRSTPNGLQLRRQRSPWVIGKLSGASSPYSFTEQVDLGSFWADGPLTGTENAYEVNGVAGLNATNHRLYPDHYGAWRFQSVKHGEEGGGVITGCCEDAIPGVLYLTFTHIHRASGCDQETHVVPLTYDVGDEQWKATITDNTLEGCDFVADCCSVFRFYLHCIGSSLGGSTWGLRITLSTLDTDSPCMDCSFLASSPCDPLVLEFDGADPTNPLCFVRNLMDCFGSSILTVTP